MTTDESNKPDPVVDALAEAGDERQEVLGRAFQELRPRLERMVQMRMDPRLRERIGASDVLQDAWGDVSRRVDDYLADPRMPFFLWVRFITAQKLLQLRRHHVEAQRRDVRRQVPVQGSARPGVTSIALANQLAARGTTPTQAAQRGDVRSQLEQALDQMSEMDREILALRHFEGLTNSEAAAELGIEKKAASKRYLRALERIRDVLDLDALGEQTT
ncbi:MAG: sigma-70 family RNA polymerase sigma factor [Planctomycetota bacterium]|nr:sigma-70 family RNA polymerase sigma factor [Planctomycetota bacterium]